MPLRGRFHELREERERGQIIVLFALFLTVCSRWDPSSSTWGTGTCSDGISRRRSTPQHSPGARHSRVQPEPELATASDLSKTPSISRRPHTRRMSHNPLMEDTTDVHVVLNSTPSGPGEIRPRQRSRLVDRRARDALRHEVPRRQGDGQWAPLLWGWIPFFPDLKTRARVEVSQIKSTTGLRPLGVPEVDPEQVAVVFVNEDGNPN